MIEQQQQKKKAKINSNPTQYHIEQAIAAKNDRTRLYHDQASRIFCFSNIQVLTHEFSSINRKFQFQIDHFSPPFLLQALNNQIAMH